MAGTMLTLGLALAAAAPPPALAQPSLAPLASFVGHCWAGEAPGNGGLDTHCFEPVFGGQHVRDRHVVRAGGADVYWGESLYSAEGGKLGFTYWNSLGGLGRGTAVADGDVLRFTGSVHATPQAHEERYSTVWRKVDGGYEVRDGDAGAVRLFRRTD
ncbi:MAG: hypothetical protein ABIS38_00415 [Sphingomicrobium sp.]